MKKTWCKNYFIETDYKVDPTFWTPYITDKWEDSNQLYKEYVKKVTSGKTMNKFFVQEITTFDTPLLRLIKTLWNHFAIRPRNFRCNFFRVLPGGELPIHIDALSQCSMVIPITENTGELYFKDDNNELSILYNTLTVLNTKKPHGVKQPSKERIVFHMGIHDIAFDCLK